MGLIDRAYASRMICKRPVFVMITNFIDVHNFIDVQKVYYYSFNRIIVFKTSRYA